MRRKDLENAIERFNGISELTGQPKVKLTIKKQSDVYDITFSDENNKTLLSIKDDKNFTKLKTELITSALYNMINSTSLFVDSK